MVRWCMMRWLLLMRKDKYNVEVVDLRTLSPLDEETIIHSVVKTGRCLVVHEAPRTLGMAAEVIAVINEKALYDLQLPVERLTGYDIVIPLPKLEDYYMPSKERIVKRVEKMLR